jgi:hypothetical protein
MGVFHIFGYTAIAGIILMAIQVLFKKTAFSAVNLLRNWMGSLFIFSGVVKAIDPLGTAYKIAEYFEVLHLDFLNRFSVAFSVGMIVLELVLGVAMIIAWKPKITNIITLLLIIFFCFLTGYTYLSGWDLHKLTFDAANMKVTSCGCFGDFIKLEPKVSFFKDLILLVGCILMMIWTRKIKGIIVGPFWGNIIITLSLVISIWFCLRNYVWNEPIVDFRPYKIGTDIKAASIPGKAPVVEMAFKYKNKKSGEEKVFSLKELPKDMDNWAFVDRSDKILDPGIPAKITGFIVQNENGEEVTESLLNDANYSFWVVTYNINKTNKEGLKNKVNPIMNAALKAGYNVMGLSQNATPAFAKEVGDAYPIFFCDEVPLKTMGRGNPVILLIRNGVIIDKWHWSQLPEFNDIAAKDLKK